MSELQISEEQASESTHPNVDRTIDPRAALPTQLQGITFDDDLWNRVKAHPVRNPSLTRNSLGDDAETREIVRQVMAAANEREKEVLLHNQARVFQEVLGRVLSAAWSFMNTPLFTSEIKHSPPHPRGIASPPKADDPDAAPDQPPNQEPGMLQSLLAFAATPKNVLALLSTFLLFTTGYSQLQVAQLEDSIQSYQAAAQASDELRDKLNQAVSSAKSERAELEDQLGAQRVELANLRAENHEQDQQLAEGGVLMRGLEDDKLRLEEALKQSRENKADDVKAVQAQAAALREQVLELEKKHATASASLSSERERVAELRSTLRDQGVVLGKQTDKHEQLSDRNAKLLNRLADQQHHMDLLRFAEACIANIEQEEDRWGDIDEEVIVQLLEEYDSAKKNLGF